MTAIPILVMILAAAQAPSPATAPAGNAATGKRLYMSYYCYACHGTQGQGGKDGVRIAPNPPAFAAFHSYVRKPSGTMPAYTSLVVTEQELADLYAFLKTIPQPPSAKSIPLLNR